MKKRHAQQIRTGECVEQLDVFCVVELENKHRDDTKRDA